MVFPNIFSEIVELWANVIDFGGANVGTIFLIPIARQSSVFIPPENVRRCRNRHLREMEKEVEKGLMQMFNDVMDLQKHGKFEIKL